jgi:hypothetical protein
LPDNSNVEAASLCAARRAFNISPYASRKETATGLRIAGIADHG